MSRILFGIYQHHQKEITDELMTSMKYQPVTKDILIIVYNQVDYLRRCVESINQHTQDFHLWIWDNGSDVTTQIYLDTLHDNNNVTVIRSEDNQGFIIPNNRLAAMGSNPYIILLNSDTEVMANWDKPLIAWLQQNPDVGATGYQGCVLDERGKGGLIRLGYEIDYISGWCLCTSRAIYDEIGLFDEDHLEFAYCEDCDFSLRLKENGRRVYALHMTQVAHFENKTITTVAKGKPQWLQDHFDHNHQYLRERWSTFLGRSFTVDEL
jgi:GT2 family glycosyltransferase